MTFDSLHKTRARHAAKMIRSRLGEQSPDASVELISHWAALNIKAGIIACYLPIKTEISPLPLMRALADAGHRLALPCIKRAHHPLEFRSYKIGDKLRGGAFGTKEPLRNASIVTPDVVLLPLLSYSRIGMRLGYGGGYYDRTLEILRKQHEIIACALAYSGQEVPTLDTQAHDQKLDCVLTETGFKDFTCA